MAFTVYILSCADGSFHLGITKNLHDRLDYHASGQHLITGSKLPVTLVFEHSFDQIRDAKAFHDLISKHNDTKLAEIIAGKVEVKFTPIDAGKVEKLNDQSVILPAVYLPNIAYLEKVKHVSTLILDTEELFQKQTYRSRCNIYGANGVQNLVVPVERPNGKQTKMKDVKISYAENWQKDHIRAIESAYRRAPFYDYYVTELFSIFDRRHENLIDLNLAMTAFLCRALKINCTVKPGNKESTDLEGKILVSPKARLDFEGKAYTQVLNESEFEPNLSGLDILFNVGVL